MISKTFHYEIARKRNRQMHHAFLFAVLVLILSLAAPSSGISRAYSQKAGAKKQAETSQAHAYPTVAMRSGKLDQDRSSGVIYLSVAQREERRITINNGLVYSNNGKLVSETKSKKQNLNNYVMDSAGRFYLFDEFTNPHIRHSSIFDGEPVAGAGNIQISNGHIIYIDSDSGHYPSKKLFPNVLTELKARGVDVSGFGGTGKKKH